MALLVIYVLVLAIIKGTSSLNQIDAADVGSSPVSCGTSVRIPVGSSVTFTSPNYPNNYGFGLCVWSFYANTTSAKVKIDCSDFTLQGRFFGLCSFDYLFLSLGPLHNEVFCGTQGPQGTTSDANWVLAKFKASLFNHQKGFTCTATAV